MYLKYFSFLVLLVGMVSCTEDASQKKKEAPYVQLQGETMGTYYRVTYSQENEASYQAEIDGLLRIINLEVSTYINHSTISKFNQADTAFSLNYLPETQESTAYPNAHFLANFKKAKEVYQQTQGYFDPTVMPLVNYWGFGYDEKKKVERVDSLLVDSLKQLVGFDKVALDMDQKRLTKSAPGVQLDFSAIAKGYAVDEIARLLSEEKGVANYLVDIGGEVVARGVNAKGNVWKIGINVPKEGASTNEIQTAVSLENQALATSGNYRNFYEVEGNKYSHTISPQTGFPERNTLLSASVFASDCMTADAYATAFMVMGPERAFRAASQHKEIEAYFIIGNLNGGMEVKYTSGLATLFEQ
jgi:thiamine biosynthesis lipoprotein